MLALHGLRGFLRPRIDFLTATGCPCPSRTFVIASSKSSYASTTDSGMLTPWDVASSWIILPCSFSKRTFTRCKRSLSFSSSVIKASSLRASFLADGLLARSPLPIKVARPITGPSSRRLICEQRIRVPSYSLSHRLALRIPWSRWPWHLRILGERTMVAIYAPNGHFGGTATGPRPATPSSRRTRDLRQPSLR